MKTLLAGWLFCSVFVFGAEFRLFVGGLNSVYSTDLDGQGEQTVFSRSHGMSIIVDRRNGKLYWVADEFGTFKRSELDGSNQETLFSLGYRTDITDFDVDNIAGHIFWAEFILSEIRVVRANLDGSDEVVLHISNPPLFEMGVELVPEVNKVYWCKQDSLTRSNFDGTDPETIVTGDFSDTFVIGHDSVAGKIYWDHTIGDFEIRRANYDGTQVEVFLDSLQIQDQPYHFTIDPFCGTLYWTEGSVNPFVKRINLDGTSQEQFFMGDRAVELAVFSATGFLDVVAQWPSMQSASCFLGMPGILELIPLIPAH